MEEYDWVVLTTISGALQAEVISGLLEAQGVPTVLLQESAGQYAYPVTYGKLGKVELYVPGALLERAKQVLADFEAGAFEAPEESENGEEDAATGDPPVDNY